MAVEFDEDMESGSTLRNKLEEALAENRKLREEKASLVARDVIRDKGLNLVAPEDLAGVAPDEIEAKAVEVQETKLAARKQMIREVLAQKGVAEDRLDDAVEEFLTGTEQVAPQFSEVNEAIRMGGVPAKGVDPQKLDAFGKIQLAMTKGN